MINVGILLKFYFICSFFLQFYTEKIMCLKVSNSADTFPLWNLRSAWILCKFFWGIILWKNMQSLYLGLFCAIWSQGLIFEDIITVFSLDSCVGGCTFLMSNNNFEIICKIFIRLFKYGHDTRSLSFHSSHSLCHTCCPSTGSISFTRTLFWCSVMEKGGRWATTSNRRQTYKTNGKS